MGTRPVTFGLAIPPIFAEPRVDRGRLRAFRGRAEELGYESLWTQEQILGAAGSLEPATLLAYAAALTAVPRDIVPAVAA